jgi:hypothetical protein
VITKSSKSRLQSDEGFPVFPADAFINQLPWQVAVGLTALKIDKAK